LGGNKRVLIEYPGYNTRGWQVRGAAEHLGKKTTPKRLMGGRKLESGIKKIIVEPKCGRAKKGVDSRGRECQNLQQVEG